MGEVLVVCSGNTCRSPFVERVLRHELDGTGIAVSSAGTGALDGATMSLATRELLGARGLDAGGFSARRLVPELADAADLVLALTGAHAASVRLLAPGACVVVLGALPRVLGTLALRAVSPAGRLMAVAAAVRGVTDEPSDDVPDPFGLGPDAYAAAAERMLPPTLALAEALRGPGSQD